MLAGNADMHRLTMLRNWAYVVESWDQQVLHEQPCGLMQLFQIIQMQKSV